MGNTRPNGQAAAETDLTSKGASALVTGASGGIGRAIAVALGACGMQVVVTGRRSAALSDTADAIRDFGGHAIVQVADLSHAESTAELARKTQEVSTGRLAVLVHCAALYQRSSTERADWTAFDALWHVNVRSPILLTQRVLPALRAAKGYIVFMNSSAVLHPQAELGAYTASKAALRAFADCLRAEVNPDGLRVLSVFPGRTATRLQAELFAHAQREYRPERLLQTEEIAKATLAAVQLPRTAEVTELHIRPALKSGPS